MPTVPPARPEQVRHPVGGQRVPVTGAGSEVAMRSRSAADQKTSSERVKPESRSEPRSEMREQREQREPRRPEPAAERREYHGAQRYHRDDDENSLESLKRKVGELTAVDRKILNYLVTKKRITRNLNEVLEKNTLAAEKVIEFAGSWLLVVVVMALWFAGLAVLLLRSGAPIESKLLFAFLGLAVIWASLVLVGLKARIVRERERAALEYEMQLKQELDIRALRDRIDSEIAPRAQETAQLLRRLADRLSKQQTDR